METLFRLQELDLRLLDKQREIDSYESELRSRREAMDLCTGRIDEATIRRKELVNERALAERRVEDSKALLKDRRARLSRVRNEKELRAGETEVSVLVEEIDEQEEKLLELMGRVETLESELDRLRAEYADIEQADHRHVEDEAERIETLRQELARERTDREGIACGLDATLRRRYELVLSRRGDRAVVKVHNGSCSGCYMRIPPQTVIEIMKSGVVRVCPSCQRILYVAETG